jgi:hypothetical protein
MKRRTAMQTLIHEISKSPISNLSILNLIENLRLLEVEKEQIINANRDGVDMVVDKKDFISGEQYYNETFNNNDK